MQRTWKKVKHKIGLTAMLWFHGLENEELISKKNEIAVELSQLKMIKCKL